MEAETLCPYCGESITLWIDEGNGPTQRYVEDCSICCRPIEVCADEAEDGSFSITALRSDE